MDQNDDGYQQRDELYEPLVALDDELNPQELAMDVIEDNDDYDSDECDLDEEMGQECWSPNDDFDMVCPEIDRNHYRELPKLYSFQPLRLRRCHYKSRHAAGQFPMERSGHRIIASESHLYSLGGYNPKSEPDATRQCRLFQELWAFNFATGRWKLILDADKTDMPRELASNALVIYNNVLISHGGTGHPFGDTCSNDCYVYTTGENPQAMLLKVTGDLPAAQYGPGIVIHDDYLYTIGGTTGFEYSCDVYRLNLITKVWENVYICRPEMRDDPEGRYRHEVVYDGHHIYVLGGGTSVTVYDLQRIPAFNLETNCWDHFDTLPDRTAASSQDLGYPEARKCFSCVQHKNSNGDIEAFITGGFQGDLATHFDDIWKLNLRTKQWYKIHTATLPLPLYFHSAASAGNGCMYIFGGIEYNGKEIMRRNDIFKMWMTIPKLSDICWDAITYYNPNLDRFNQGTLLGAGIPDRYANRLTNSGPVMHKNASEGPSSSLLSKEIATRSHVD